MSRNNYDQIGVEMVYDSATDVIMGAGNPWFGHNGEPRTTPNTFKYAGGQTTRDELVTGTAGSGADGDGDDDPWVLVQTREEFQALMSGETPQRVLGTAQVYQALQQSRGGNGETDPYAVPLIETVPTLEEMTKAALNVLDAAYHLSGDDSVDHTAARAFTRLFAERLLSHGMPYDVQALHVNIPPDATPDTSWWLARLSRRRYYLPQAPDRANGQGRPGYLQICKPEQAEFDSNVWAVLVARVVAVTPLSLDLTSRTDFGAFGACLRADSDLTPQILVLPWPSPVHSLGRATDQGSLLGCSRPHG